MTNENKSLTSFNIDKDILENLDFRRARAKRGFLKKFLNDKLREAFITPIEINEENKETA